MERLTLEVWLLTLDQGRGWQGGTFEMCQLWLNLPAKNKMDPPNYQVQVRRGIFCALLCSSAAATANRFMTA